jgi:hypothetical protein
MPRPQNFENHGRIVPAWHIGVFFIFIANFFWAISRLFGAVTAEAIMELLLAVAFLLVFAYTRIQVLTVQDRVIRLEMRLRLKEVLPADLQARMQELTLPQLIALRFAGDSELPDLVREVLAGTLTRQKEIKKRVKNWQADYVRA